MRHSGPGRHLLVMLLFAIAALAAAAPSQGAQRVIPAPVTMGDSIVANPVTNEIVILGGGTAAGQIAVLDPATEQVRSGTLGATPVPGATLQLDPFRNRAYLMLSGGSLVAIDLVTLAVAPVASGIASYQIDPGNDRVWARQGSSLVAIDGATFAIESFSAWPPALFWNSGIGGFRADPVAGTVHVAVNGYDDFGSERWFAVEVGGSPLQVLSTSSVFTGWTDGGLGLEPHQRVVCFGRLEVTPTGGGCVAWPSGALSNLLLGGGGLLDFAGHAIWRAGPLAYDYGVPTPWFNQPWNAGIVIDPATRRLYALIVPPADYGELRSVDLDTGAWQTFGPPAATPALIRSHQVDVATHRVYWIGNLSVPDPIGIVEIDEPVAAPVPMPTTITPGTPSASGDVTVDLAATSAWAPFDHPILRIFYQVDSTDGRWLRAAPDGASAQVALTGLAPGPHTIHAFATDGLESLQGTIVTGPIASVVVQVPTPTACSNGSDDDGDGLADFPDDPGCYDAAGMLENPQCDDGADNDADGGFDWDGGGVGAPDPQCVGKPFRNREAPNSCGLGAEIALALGVIGFARRRSRRI